MISITTSSFYSLKIDLKELMRDAPSVKTERWQGVAANTDTRELYDVNVSVILGGEENLHMWRAEIWPNLPWADDHFRERVGGEPLNPGEQWKNWPWGLSASKFTTETRFNHTYAERLWPKYARMTDDGKLPLKNVGPRRYPHGDRRGKYGIGHNYGDLWDLVLLLVKEPHTRQAWIPLFFPEDTGIGDGGRKPCTLGYHLIRRNDELSIWYPLRSCDLVRHWADDCYLAVRLLLWVLDRCREQDPARWDHVRPGNYGMHMTSLHVFESDMANL
jgi:hypothetical protein